MFSTNELMKLLRLVKVVKNKMITFKNFLLEVELKWMEILSISNTGTVIVYFKDKDQKYQYDIDGAKVPALEALVKKRKMKPVLDYLEKHSIDVKKL